MLAPPEYPPPFHLTAEQWQVVFPVLAPHLPLQGARGRPPIDERRVLDAILWKIINHAPWYDLPSCYPSHQTCYRRYRLWIRRGVLPQVFAALVEDCRTRGGLDIPQLLQDTNFALAFVQGDWRAQVAPEHRATWQYAVLLLYRALLVHNLKARNLNNPTSGPE